MDGLYYEKQFVVGKNGEKFALLNVDSCLLLCDTLIKDEMKGFDKLDQETTEVFLSWCEGGGMEDLRLPFISRSDFN